jgi:hypothetical protein
MDPEENELIKLSYITPWSLLKKRILILAGAEVALKQSIEVSKAKKLAAMLRPPEAVPN